ncbi:MAG: polysaccharide deacetylase family protein [Clostridia bacterium]|nr:polysaccharide deacetylase family protein [Clostridia bacterium]
MNFFFYFRYIKSKMFFKILSFSIICAIFSAFILLAFPFSKYSKNVKAEENVSLVIIMYHSILKSKSRQGEYVITPEDFENDLKYITENGYQTVFLSDVIDYVYGEKNLPEKPIIITFDDGYYNNYLYGFPLLKKYNCKAVISPIVKFTELYSQNGDQNALYSHITWNDMSEMANSGLVEFANHSYNLHKTSDRKGANKKNGEEFKNYKSFLEDDLKKSQQLIFDNIGITTNTFTYPFGAYSDDSEKIIKEFGFKASLVCEEKINNITREDENCLYRLGRFLRPGNISSSKFFLSKKL